jgi:hypothetical protein
MVDDDEGTHAVRVSAPRSLSGVSSDARRRRPGALLVAAGVVALQGFSFLGFAAWNLLRRSSEEPSNPDVYQGATVYLALFGVLIVVVAGALVARKRWAFGAAVFLQLLALFVTYEMATGGFWLGAGLLGLACVGALVALFSAPARAALGRG